VLIVQTINRLALILSIAQIPISFGRPRMLRMVCVISVHLSLFLLSPIHGVHSRPENLGSLYPWSLEPYVVQQQPD